MANLQKCSRCKSEVDISYFGLNRKKQPYKTCEKCRSMKKTQPIKRTDIDFVDDNVSTTTPDTSEPPEHDPPKMAYKRSIPIDATDVAALLGLNKYKTNLHEIVMKYWERGFPIKFRDTRD